MNSYFRTLLVGIVFATGACAMQDFSVSALEERIETTRKGDCSVILPGWKAADGPVSYRLFRHHFEFGVAIAPGFLGIDGARLIRTPRSDEDVQNYTRIVTTLFSAAVAENHMKWQFMEREDGVSTPESALALYEWCQQQNLFIRGHCVMWGVKRWQPQWLIDLPPEETKDRILGRMRQIQEVFSGKIDEWDLNNEMMHQDIFAEKLGLENGAAYFKWAKEIAPGMTFYVNEFGVLQGNEVDRYVAHIRELLANGAEIGGIGDQAHFHGPLPESEKLWEILDKLGSFGLPVKITEFDLAYKGMTEEAQADDLERFYRLCFAHPAVEGLYMWGFYENAHWRRNAALWNTDWTPRQAAQRLQRLLTEDWTTAGESELDKNELRFRGFYGQYKIRQGEREWTVTLTPQRRSAEAVPLWDAQ